MSESRRDTKLQDLNLSFARSVDYLMSVILNNPFLVKNREILVAIVSDLIGIGMAMEAQSQRHSNGQINDEQFIEGRRKLRERLDEVSRKVLLEVKKDSSSVAMRRTKHIIGHLGISSQNPESKAQTQVPTKRQQLEQAWQEAQQQNSVRSERPLTGHSPQPSGDESARHALDFDAHMQHNFTPTKRTF